MLFRSSSLLIMLPLITMLAACGNKKQEKTSVAPINVRVLSMNNTDRTAQEISYNGTVKESKSITLAFQVSGTIIQINAEKGQQVKKGQLLAAIDETVYRDQYNAQLAQQKLAQDNYRRIDEVYKKGSIAEVKVVEARSNADQAVSMAKATYQNIAHTKLYAPTDGYIGEKTAEAGNLAAPGAPVLKLVKLDEVNILVAVPEAEINKFSKGQTATVKVAALGNRDFKGIIDEVAVVSDGASHNYNVKIRVSNRNGQLKPGMVANVFFAGDTHENKGDSSAVRIPLIALQVDEQNNNFVYVVNKEGNKAERKKVKRGELMNEVVVISKGLTPSDRVIVSGYQKITSGTAVKIVQ